MSITRSLRWPLFALILLAMSAAADAQFSISVSFGPPELPVYEQPMVPGEGYIWTPGYWVYAGDDDGYYWVPGTWVMAPEPGLLWTPAYWSWGGNGYIFNNGYWGREVGFYGGVSYGYGYYGDGYQGGRWQNGQFYYNRSVSNVNVSNIHNIYNTTVINNTTSVNRVSYNGGNGGISARPTSQQESVARERRIPPVAAQTQHEQAARTNPEQRASLNHGTPAVAATPRPGAFTDRNTVRAKEAGTAYNAPRNRAAGQPAANSPSAHPENGAARPERPVPNHQSEPYRTPSVRPNQPEPNRAPAEQPNSRHQPNRNEPTQGPPNSRPDERSQPERPTPSEARPPRQQQPPPANNPGEKKGHDEKPQ